MDQSVEDHFDDLILEANDDEELMLEGDADPNDGGRVDLCLVRHFLIDLSINFLAMWRRLKEGDVLTEARLVHLDVWVHIYDVLIGFVSEGVGKQLGNYIGTFLEYDTKNNGFMWHNYMRVRVRLDVRLPLKKHKMIKLKNGSIKNVMFKYERLPSFCYYCGLMGHIEKFCPKLFEASDRLAIAKEWGSKLRAFVSRITSRAGDRWLRNIDRGVFADSWKEKDDDVGSDRSRGRDSWNILRSLATASSLPWKRTPDVVEERLDRALASSSWLQRFRQVRLQNVVAPISDHSLLVLDTDARRSPSRSTWFKVENSYLTELELHPLIENS
ncbi:hypothetical protein PTKIN_Ptkin01aG0065600 [Pterospermum kingtungense]